MSNHVFGHENGDEALTIVNRKRHAYHFRQNHAAARPCLNDFFTFIRFDFLGEMLVDEWAFFNGSWH